VVRFCPADRGATLDPAEVERRAVGDADTPSR
jgi:hypothetical protein